MMGTRCAGQAWPRSDLLSFTGVWSTVPVTGLSSPSAITGDTAGNLYVTDFTLSSVIRIAADGTQTSIGSGLSSPAGVAADGFGNLYVTSNGDSKVYKITAGGAQTTLGGGWSTPLSIAVDSTGNVYVTDDHGLSEVSAGGTQSLLVPGIAIRGAAVDAGNNVYYGDNASNHIYEIPFGTTTPAPYISTAATAALFVDGQGNVFTAKATTGVLHVDDPAGDTTTFGNTTVSEGAWEDSRHNLYIADAAGSVEKLALGAIDFGSINVCPAGARVTPCSAVQTLHFALDANVSATAAMQSVTEGIAGLDYRLSADTCTGALSNGAVCSVIVTFSPQQAGLRAGAAQAIGSSSSNLDAAPDGPQPRIAPAAKPRDQPPGSELTTVLLHGLARAPIGVFNTAPIQTYGFTSLANNFESGVTVSADGNLYVTDSVNCVVQKDFISNSNITTVVAGTGCGVAAGDGAGATSATLDEPVKTVLDGAGNLYIGGFHCTVRKVDAVTGNISTFAGGAGCGSAGDGGLAVNATLQQPIALALDSEGDLFIADQSGNVVRRVDAITGIITTVAGTGAQGYTGDGGAAIAAELNYPDALAIDDAGNLYIADDNNNVVRKVAAGVITTIAGTGSAGYRGDGGLATSARLNDPKGLALDPAGDLYIADAGNYLVRKVEANNGIITTAVGVYTGAPAYSGDGGSATEAGLNYDEDIAIDVYGNIFIADTRNHVVREVIASIGVASFGSVPLGSSSAAQDVSYSNVGTSALTLTGLQASTNYSLGGADTTCTVSTTLAAGAGCVLGIELAPSAAGSLPGTIQIGSEYDSSPRVTQNVYLSGTGGGGVAATKLAIAAAVPTVMVGGNLGTIGVAVESSGGGVVAGATNVVMLAITGPGGYAQTVTATAVNGLASFPLQALPLTTAGSYTLTATSGELTQAVAVAMVVANLTAATALAIPASVPSSLPAGGNLGIVPVDIVNDGGTVIVSATNAVTLTLTGPGGYLHTATVTAANGVAGFDLSALVFAAPGVYTLTATATGLSPASDSVTVTSGSLDTAVRLALPTTLPASLAAGGNLGMVPVDIEDDAGTLIVSATNTITLTITGPNGYAQTQTVVAVNGVAGFDLSALPLLAPGTYTLTASSGNLTPVIATIGVSADDFTIMASSGTPEASSPIPPGMSATFSFTLGAASGSFPSPITLSASGLPAGATCSFSPATVTPGADSVTTALTLQTASSAPAALATGWGSIALLLLPFFASRRMRRVLRQTPLLTVALLLFTLGSVAGLAGCGTSGQVVQPQSYPITVTGTSGTISHSVTVTLIVQ